MRNNSFVYLGSASLHALLTGFLRNLYCASQMPEIFKHVAWVRSHNRCMALQFDLQPVLSQSLLQMSSSSYLMRLERGGGIFESTPTISPTLS